jgi:hypothetical protein
MDHEPANISPGLHRVVACSVFRDFICISSSVDGVTEAQLAGLAENVIRVDVAD